MRNALKFALTMAVMACISMPLNLLAQNQVLSGTVGGRSVDAAGRGVSGERVELLIGTQVITSVTTNNFGEWSFKGVQPGDYTVRMNVRGRIAGVRVTVAAGQVVSRAMIVVPAASASLQLGMLANLLTLVPAAAASTASVAAATVQDVETVELSPALLVAILNELPAADRKAFADAVVAAIGTGTTGTAPFAQYKDEFVKIAANPAAPVVATSFTPPADVS